MMSKVNKKKYNNENIMGNQRDRSVETSKSTTAFSFSSAIEKKHFFA